MITMMVKLRREKVKKVRVIIRSINNSKIRLSSSLHIEVE